VGIQGYLNSPLVVGSLVIVPSSGTVHDTSDAADGVYALDLASGDVLWHAKTDNDANGAAIAGDRVVVTADDGTVRALALSTGRELWKASQSAQVYTHPLLMGDEVVVGDESGVVRALDLKTGGLKWRFASKGAIRGDLASDGSLIYVVSQRARHPRSRRAEPYAGRKPCFDRRGTGKPMVRSKDTRRPSFTTNRWSSLLGAIPITGPLPLWV
jgi:outer membrane protein assembly factor BamB